MNESVKLPLKVVPPLERDFYRPDVGGGPKKVFRQVTRAFRNELAQQVLNVAERFAESFKEFPAVPAVARVRVREDAIAKSHRPTAILTPQTCPIIGAQGLGELLLSVTPVGLRNLARRIEQDDTKQGIANLSTLKAFEPYQSRLEMPVDSVTKVKLFRHNRADLDGAIDDAFLQVLQQLRVKDVDELNYSNGLKIYRLRTSKADALRSISRYVGTQSVGPFPVYLPVRSTAIPIRAALPNEFPAPDKRVDYPVLGIVDSGTSETDPHLIPWRTAREVYVAPGDQDNTHGSFVAGLAVHPRLLNHKHPRFPSCSSQFVDVVALSRYGTTEDKLLAVLEEVLVRYPEVKIWNLSLGTGASVDNRTFSDLAAALDRLQRERNVSMTLRHLGSRV